MWDWTQRRQSFPVVGHCKGMYYSNCFLSLPVKTASSMWMRTSGLKGGSSYQRTFSGALARMAISPPVPNPEEKKKEGEKKALSWGSIRAINCWSSMHLLEAEQVQVIAAPFCIVESWVSWGHLHVESLALVERARTLSRSVLPRTWLVKLG